MLDDDGSVVVGDWAVGFALGIGLRRKEWAERILLTKHCDVLIRILVYCEGELDLLPAIPLLEKQQRQATAHQQIAQAVAAARAICNPIPIAPLKLAASPANGTARPATAVSRRGLRRLLSSSTAMGSAHRYRFSWAMLCEGTASRLG